MGQTLSEPVTAKETTSCGNSVFKIGSSCMQGWRVNMEDAHTHILSLPEDPPAAFFAVYDGHGGAKVAHYAGSHLHTAITSTDSYKAGDYAEAMRTGFLAIDEDMLRDEEMREEMAGTTAIAILVRDGRMFVGNVGDSRAVACFAGKADPLSVDHKPSLDSEAKRITAAGGWVEFNRVNGNLALSRALGDFVFKRNDKKDARDQIVTAFPDIQSRSLTDELEFVVIACDGIWDVLSNEEVVDFIRKRIAAHMEPQTICEELMTRCLAPGCQMGGLGCDNMTVILICYLNGKSYEDLAAKCAVNPDVLAVRAAVAAAGGANNKTNPSNGVHEEETSTSTTGGSSDTQSETSSSEAHADAGSERTEDAVQPASQVPAAEDQSDDHQQPEEDVPEESSPQTPSQS